MTTENKVGKEQRVFNVTEYAEKARKALKKLETEQKAGQATTGGKTAVLAAVKDELKDLTDKGYTVQQIADALKDDVFAILPKSITTAIHGKKKPAKRQPKNTNTTGDLVTTQQTGSTRNTAAAAGSFNIKQDSEDL